MKMVGKVKMLKVEWPEAHGVFYRLKKKKKCKNKEISLRMKIRILEATVMTIVKYGSEVWALRKTDNKLPDIYQRNCL